MSALKNLFLIFSLALCTNVYASIDDFYHRSAFPFYVGVTGGYGATTWGQLVPAKENQNMVMNLSAPIHVKEGGGIWGVFLGYEFIPFFAVEASYIYYPEAAIKFDAESLFVFNNGITTLKTETEQLALVGKLMLPLFNTKIRVFSSVGAAGVHRRDTIADEWGLHPTFGVGLNYAVADHWMADISIDYTAGYGESELSPVAHYIPFLYSASIRIAYRF